MRSVTFTPSARRRTAALIGIGMLVAIGPVPKLELYAPEVLCLALLPWTLPVVVPARYGRGLLVLVGAAALGYLTAFAISGGRPGEAFVAVARVVALVATASAVLWRQRRHDDVRGLLVGALAGAVVYGAWAHAGDSAANIWKFGVGDPLMLLGVAALSRTEVRLGRLPAYLYLVIIAILSAALDFRSLSLIAFAACLIIVVVDHTRSRGATVAMIAVGLLVGIAVVALYATAVSEGWLGTAAKYRYQRQEQSASGFGPVSLLGVARATTFIDLTLVATDPLVGHGTRPRLTTEDVSRARRLMSHFGVEQSEKDVLSSWQTMREHSLLFEAWIEGGVAAAAFFFYLLGWVLPSWIWSAARNSPLLPLAVAGSVLGGWDVLFSPVAATNEFSLAVTVGLAAALGQKAGRPMTGARL